MSLCATCSKENLLTASDITTADWIVKDNKGKDFRSLGKKFLEISVFYYNLSFLPLDYVTDLSSSFSTANSNTNGGTLIVLTQTL